TGTGKLTGSLSLFYDASLNFSLEALTQTLKSVFESAIELNPLTYQAKLLVQGIQGLDPNFKVPANVQAILDDPSQSVNAVFDSLSDLGYKASPAFQSFINNAGKALDHVGKEVTNLSNDAKSDYTKGRDSA